MTGSATDADDLVQATFARALERPPAEDGREVRPWLVKVAMNLARDQLRRRRRRTYQGPWLPWPLDDSLVKPLQTQEVWSALSTPQTRYDLAESASFAFLLALEALTPQQRAVLILRDVLDYSVRETAEALSISQSNTKTTLHRARRVMENYDRERRPINAETKQRYQQVLIEFMTLLLQGDSKGLEQVLAQSVTMSSDSGGEFLTARKVLEGKRRVLAFFLAMQKKNEASTFRMQGCSINGLPAMVFEMNEPIARISTRFVIRCDLNIHNQIHALHILQASAKLSHVKPFSQEGSD